MDTTPKTYRVTQNLNGTVGIGVALMLICPFIAGGMTYQAMEAARRAALYNDFTGTGGPSPAIMVALGLGSIVGLILVITGREYRVEVTDPNRPM